MIYLSDKRTYGRSTHFTQYPTNRRTSPRFPVPDTPEPDASNPNDLAPEDGSTGGKEGGGLSPELKDLTGKAIDYYDSALSENTRRAYQ